MGLLFKDLKIFKLLFFLLQLGFELLFFAFRFEFFFDFLSLFGFVSFEFHVVL